MTILFGILCKDGVVIGADSSATLGSGQLRTIEQETRKIDIIDEKIIVAGTGQIGLGQRFCFQIKKAWDDKKFKNQQPVEMARFMCELGVKDFISTNAPMGQYGALVAFPAANKPNLCEFAITDFQPELKTEHLWYASMGSAQMIGDPFLGLMRKVFWASGPPSCQDAIFIVTWALSHAIELNPGGVNAPMQIALLYRQKNGDYKAKMLEAEELAEHKNNVEGAIEHLRSYKDILSGKKDLNTPQLPQP